MYFPLDILARWEANCHCTTQKRADARLAEERQQLKWQKDHMYDDIHTEEQMAMSSNQDRDEGYLSDFM